MTQRKSHDAYTNTPLAMFSKNAYHALNTIASNTSSLQKIKSYKTAGKEASMPKVNANRISLHVN